MQSGAGMKDILTRITKAEKEAISFLRALSPFELKDLLNEVQNLIVLSKVTEAGFQTDLAGQLLDRIKSIFEEREDYMLQKFARRRTASATAVATAAGNRNKKSPVTAGYLQPTLDSEDEVFEINPEKETRVEKEEPLTDQDLNLPVDNNIINKFKSRGYRSYILNTQNVKKEQEAK